MFATSDMSSSMEIETNQSDDYKLNKPICDIVCEIYHPKTLMAASGIIFVEIKIAKEI